jgi:hypothetical protein
MKKVQLEPLAGKKDPLKEYDEKEPATSAKIREHEPTAVKRDPSNQNIGEIGTPNPEDARERDIRSGMTKGIASAAETGDEYKQGAARINK